MSDFTQKQLMKKVKSFNNNPNSSLFKVNIKPKSARGLFGASTSENPISRENSHGLQKPELCNQQSYKDHGQVIMTDMQSKGKTESSCPGETLHQPAKENLGYSPSSNKLINKK